MEFMAQFLDNFVEACGETIGVLGCVFIYLSIFSKARKNWSPRKEVGILILVSLGLMMVVALFAALSENAIGHCK